MCEQVIENVDEEEAKKKKVEVICCEKNFEEWEREGEKERKS